MENMSTREKIDHIWYYYKIHIIVGILAIAMLSNLIFSIATNKKPVLNMTLLGTFIDTDKQELLEKDMTSKFIDNPKKKTAELLFINYSSDSKDQMSMVGIQKFDAMLGAQSIDITVIDKNLFLNMAGRGSFVKLDDLKDLNLPETKGLNPLKLQPEGTSTPGIYGIPADSIKALNDIGYDTKDKIICIAANTPHMNLAVKCLNWLLGSK